LFDHSLIAIRRELVGDRRLKPVAPMSLVNTRSAGLIRFAKYIPPDDFTRLATLMRDVPPKLIGGHQAIHALNKALEQAELLLS
jgi:hypothetical protein